jgi:hypothetical protein
MRLASPFEPESRLGAREAGAGVVGRVPTGEGLAISSSSSSMSVGIAVSSEICRWRSPCPRSGEDSIGGRGARDGNAHPFITGRGAGPSSSLRDGCDARGGGSGVSARDEKE